MARTNKSDEQTSLWPCTQHGDSLCYVHPVTQEHEPRFNCKCGATSHPKCPVESHRHSARLDK